MTLNILFFSITFQKHQKTAEAYLKDEYARRLCESHADRVFLNRNY